MNALLSPRRRVASAPAPRRVTAAAACAAVLAALSGCVVAPPPPPSGVILSRLAPGQPGAADSAHPLSPEERKRYADIDKQVIREQNEAIAADAWTRYYAPYSPYYYSPPVSFGGYYGGWNSGWGVGYSSPGYYPGWWW
jgi:hypothetical protein